MINQKQKASLRVREMRIEIQDYKIFWIDYLCVLCVLCGEYFFNTRKE